MKANLQLVLLLGLALVTNAFVGGAQAGPEKTVAEIAGASGPSIVSLKVRGANGEELGKASGFIVDPSGVIVTNFHVIQRGQAVEVKLASGEVFDSEGVVDYNVRRDIALIKIKAARLPALTLGDSDELKEGERVVAIGNPMGLERTVSDGLVSALRILEGTRLIQISVPISPGSSGGPLFNMRGEVVGVTTAGLVAPGVQNLNLAVPSNYVVPMVAQEVRYSFPELAGTAGEEAVGGGGPVRPREFTVVHDHGDEFRHTCLGTLSVTPARIVFQGRESKHAFDVKPEDIYEVAVNVAYGAKAGAFHIRLKDWTNFNFFAVREDGTPVAPQTVVFVVQQVRGKAD